MSNNSAQPGPSTGRRSNPDARNYPSKVKAQLLEYSAEEFIQMGNNYMDSPDIMEASEKFYMAALAAVNKLYNQSSIYLMSDRALLAVLPDVLKKARARIGDQIYTNLKLALHDIELLTLYARGNTKQCTVEEFRQKIKNIHYFVEKFPLLIQTEDIKNRDIKLFATLKHLRCDHRAMRVKVPLNQIINGQSRMKIVHAIY